MNLKNKLTSRKFWIAVSAMIFGIFTALNREDIANEVAGAVTALASALTYIISEGKIDSVQISKTETTDERE